MWDSVWVVMIKSMDVGANAVVRIYEGLIDHLRKVCKDRIYIPLFTTKRVILTQVLQHFQQLYYQRVRTVMIAAANRTNHTPFRNQMGKCMCFFTMRS